MLLEITVKDPKSTSTRTLRFETSPIRIGRNQLNEISLDDPFVSDWHGIIRFGDQGIAYFDLGSTNGSLVDGARIAKNVPAPLSTASRVVLGRIELSIAMPPPAAIRPTDTGPRTTIAWGQQNRDDRTPLPRVGPRSNPLALTPPKHAKLRTGAEAGAPAGDLGVMVRQRALLEAFSEAFIGLRKGYEQFGAEVGVRTINGNTPLHRARTSRELLDYLLQPDVDLVSATRDLIGIFADFGIHHIAMMDAVTEGVRALLQSLDPRANDLDPGGRLFSAAKAKNQWRVYLERFDQAVTDDQELHAAIFGAEFARTYASVTVGDGQKRPGSDD